MQSLESTSDIYRPVPANMLFMRSCQILPICHSSQPPSQKPNRCYRRARCRKIFTIGNVRERERGDFWQCTDAACQCEMQPPPRSAFSMNKMWRLKVSGTELFNQYTRPCQWGWGPLATIEPSQVTLMWNDRGFHWSCPTASLIVIHTHTACLHCSCCSLGNRMLSPLLVCFQQMSLRL